LSGGGECESAEVLFFILDEHCQGEESVRVQRLFFLFLMSIVRESRAENSRRQEACIFGSYFVNVGVRSSVGRELG
jgi:hypothetical protein